MSELILSSPLQSLGDLLSPVRSSHHHQTIQVSCLDGRVLETQLGVGLVFYTILRDITYVSLSDLVIIMPDHTVQEISNMFSTVYNQELREDYQEVNFGVESLVDNIKEESIEGKYERGINAETVEAEDEKFKCSYCDFLTQRKDTLSQHKRRKHKTLDNVPIQCGFCEYRTPRKDTLNQHIKRQHTKQENLHIYACENCSYTSTAKFNFKSHRK